MITCGFLINSVQHDQIFVDALFSEVLNHFPDKLGRTMDVFPKIFNQKQAQNFMKVIGRTHYQARLGTVCSEQDIRSAGCCFESPAQRSFSRDWR